MLVLTCVMKDKDRAHFPSRLTLPSPWFMLLKRCAGEAGDGKDSRNLKRAGSQSTNWMWWEKNDRWDLRQAWFFGDKLMYFDKQCIRTLRPHALPMEGFYVSYRHGFDVSPHAYPHPTVTSGVELSPRPIVSPQPICGRQMVTYAAVPPLWRIQW